MFLEDVPVNYWAVGLAALAYFILGAIWYAPALFGHRWMKHEWRPEEGSQRVPQLLAYIGEAVLSLILAYILALMIEVSDARQVLEGVVVALWIWIGFIATTHFSAVLWGRKTVKSFFIHAGFMLVGLLLMGAIIPAIKNYY